jgi:diacylglycerol kinase (ATP)
MNKKIKPILIIYNPSLKNKKIREDIDKLKKYEPTIYATTNKNDDKKIKKILSEKKYETIIAIGGDGTISLVANLIARTNIKLAIIPRGSTNALFHETSTKERELSKRKTKKIDMIKINHKYCFHIAGFGINAHIIKTTRNKNIKGFIKYIISFFISITKFKKYKFQIINKEKKEKSKQNQDVFIKKRILVIANGKSYGKKVYINPKGKPDDGKFEVCTLRKQRPYKHVKIINKDRAPFHIDGEYIGHPRIITAHIEKKALTLLV